MASRARQTLSSSLVENRVSPFTGKVTSSLTLYIKGRGREGKSVRSARVLRFTRYRNCGGDGKSRKSARRPAVFQGDFFSVGPIAVSEFCVFVNVRHTTYEVRNHSDCGMYRLLDCKFLIHSNAKVKYVTLASERRM